jgi:hypothetical protein
MLQVRPRTGAGEMAKKKSRARRSGGAGTQVLRPPRERLRKLFRIPKDVTATIEALVEATPIPPNPDASWTFFFDLGVLERGINLAKAVTLLTGEGHWEIAASANRQLFELLINMEHVTADADRSAGMKRYMRFGFLQTLLHARASLLYSEATGRTVDAGQLAEIDDLLASSFDEFRSRKGRNQWIRSWSGKTARELADRSREHARKDQYRLLFTPWSEQTHAAPGALLGRMLQVETDPKELIETDDMRVTEAATMAVELLVSLADTLSTMPAIPTEKRQAWLRDLKSEIERYPRLVPHVRESNRGRS